MAIIKYSKALVEKYPELFNYNKQNLFQSIVYYLIDSKYRKSVELMKWIKPQIENEDVLRIAKEIPSVYGFDEQAMECWKWVYNNITYIGDQGQWGYPEKWSEVSETIQTRKGDCEDMHNLLYCLCRAKGIPANRLMIWTGDVQARETAPTGGHCSLLYFPEEYPLNPCFLDVCYYPNQKKITQRNLFTLVDKDLIEYKNSNPIFTKIWSSYQSTWFIFNEDFASSKYRPKSVQ